MQHKNKIKNQEKKYVSNTHWITIIKNKQSLLEKMDHGTFRRNRKEPKERINFFFFLSLKKE